MPKKHKNRDRRHPLTHKQLLAEAPGVAAMERLFASLDGVLFCVKNCDGRYLSANDALLRRAQTQLIGHTAKEVFPPLLAAGYEQQDTRVIEYGEETHDRLEMITNPDGGIGWYLSDKVPIRNSAGEVIGIASSSRDLQSSVDNDPRYARLASVIDYMRQHYSEPLRIGELVIKTELSLSSFERLTRSLLKVSPRQYLTRIRVEAAAECLKHTDQALGIIALDCGFCDQATFCRQFKAITGMTAGHYRRLSRC
ncbi:MAG: helix-turn-helix domain-containing protein [Luteolibacter sp.]